jgi:hypothetical protein
MNNFAHVPAQAERLIWWQIAGAHRAIWESSEERDELVRAALDTCAEASKRLIVIPHTSEAGLSLSTADLRAVVSSVLSAARETVWITARLGSEAWLIEISFTDKEVCFAQSLR